MSRRMRAPLSTPPVHERLLTAAMEVFATNGYTATRVSDIVQRAGVAQGTFYLYFKNKQAIFEHLIDDFSSRLFADTLGNYRLDDVSRREEVVERTRVLWRTILERCRQERALVALALRETGAAVPELVARLQAQYQHCIDGIAVAIETGTARGIFRPIHPNLAAWAIFGMMERAVYYAVLVADQADLDPLVEDLVRLQLGGLLNDPGIDVVVNRGDWRS